MEDALKVKVVGAPGFEDFYATLIIDPQWSSSVVVMCEEDSEVHVIDRTYIQEA